MEEKVLRYLGLAARGRLVATGYNTCIFMMGKKKVKLLILADDLAENSKKKMMAQAKKYNVTFRVYGNRERLSHITGQEDAGIFGITDVNLAKAILSEIDHIQSL